MSSFWFIIKQQWTIEEISIFSNSSHLEWRAGLSDIILKGIYPGTIPARFGLIWFRGFRGEDLNVKGYARWANDAACGIFHLLKKYRILLLFQFVNHAFCYTSGYALVREYNVFLLLKTYKLIVIFNHADLDLELAD